MSNGWGQNTWGTSDFGWGGVSVVSVEVTGVPASGSVGSAGIEKPEIVTVGRVATQGGWGRSSWGFGAWNEATQLPDMSMVGAVGSTSTSADANVNGIFGVAGVKFLGDEEVRSNNNISVTGFNLSGNLGSLGVRLVNRIDVTGISGSSNIGVISTIINANINVTGLSAIGSIGNNLVWGKVNTDQIPNWQEIKEAA